MEANAYVMNAPRLADLNVVPPELLAPAGDDDCLRAAIENGADAVYFGLAVGFNARQRATNFPVDALADRMKLLHRRGVRGYVTLNTLVFADELETAESLIRDVAMAGVDAVIVQDLGLARLIRETAPALAMHASTQMTLTSAEQIRVIESLGVERVILARELSIAEIRKIRQATSMPLETFVHGALCVAYSGQCLTSEALGGRSANRGQCAQACRLPYELFCDGDHVELGAQKYLLSPQDLAAHALVPDLIAAGVSSLKIEGRLKTAEYVANVTKHYRRAIDEAVAGRPARLTPAEREDLELSFSRGFSVGWLLGCDHKALVPALSSKKRGVLIGVVKGVRNGRAIVELTGSVRRGDGVAFEGAAEADETGGRVFEVWRDGASIKDAVGAGVVALSFGRGAIDFRKLAPGQRIWKTDDPRLTQRLRASFTGRDPQRKTPVDVVAIGAVGQPLTIVATAAGRAPCEASTTEPLQPAIRHPLTEATLREQLGRWGATGYELRNLDMRIEGSAMAPFSVLGALRHRIVAALDAGAETAAPALAPTPTLPRLRAPIAPPALPIAVPELRVLCRSLEQVDAALALGQRHLYVDFQDVREYRGAIARGHAVGASIFLATPRIQKPGEVGVWRLLCRQRPDGVLARNLGALRFFVDQGLPTIADFSLNAANELTIDLLRQWGAERVTPAYDLNRDQLLTLVEATNPAAIEIVAHQHMPMFHMEHCVFCAALSPGTNKTNCGRPCDRHVVELEDRMGIRHPLVADVGCRNTLFNAVPQSAAEVIPALLERGVRRYRIELLRESAEEIARVLAAYRDLLAGSRAAGAVWRELNAANRVGVTRGPLEERRHPLAIL